MTAKFIFVLITTSLSIPALDQSAAVTYQGRLSHSNLPANGPYEMQFALFDAATNGVGVGKPISVAPVFISNGLFTAILNFGSGVFNGAPRWLEISLTPFGSDQPAVTLSPRQRIMPTPYALFALEAGSVKNMRNPGFVGTTDGTPLDLYANNRRALRLEPTSEDNDHLGIVNVIGGSEGNSVPQGVYGATIAGGGATNYFDDFYVNVVSGDFGTVGGGLGNVSAAEGATVAGGLRNTADGGSATVGGGVRNRSSGDGATISGGQANISSGVRATIGGGENNQSEGWFSVVPGGGMNLAAGNFSFAAGQQAQALHDGAFVWADTSIGSFASTSSNQFAVRASGGVRLETAGAGMTLDGQPVLTGASVPGTFQWQPVSGTSVEAHPNTGYIVRHPAQTTITLPISPPLGSTIRVSNPGTGGWKIAQNPRQSIRGANLTSFGANWTLRELGEEWRAVAASGDGTQLYAVSSAQIKRSTNSGSTWTPVLTLNNCRALACSSDGAIAVAAAARLWVSTDSGLRWIQRGPSGFWMSVACSIDGTKLVAVDDFGLVITSNDSGQNWVTRNAPQTNWSAVASSADGTKLVAVGAGGIYTSADSGVTWAPRREGRWAAVASSADGLKLFAATTIGASISTIYTSTDSGANWVPGQTGGWGWGSLACSADGSKVVAAASVPIGGGRAGLYCYISSDSGATWAPVGYDFGWNSVACSADGSKLLAASAFGALSISSANTSPGTAGYLVGGQNSAIELQYVGDDLFLPLSQIGTISAY